MTAGIGAIGGLPLTALSNAPSTLAELNGNGSVMRYYAHGQGTDNPVMCFPGSPAPPDSPAPRDECVPGAGFNRLRMLDDERGSVIATICASVNFDF